MLRSYLVAAWRALGKNRTFSIVNIAGLTLGTTCCLYILLYVSDQYSYDRHHKHAEDIYRVICRYDVRTKGTTDDVATTASQVAPLMARDLAEVEQYARVVPFAGIDENLLRYGGKSLYEKEAVYVDSTFFSLFSYHFVKGRAADALNRPNTVVLVASVAEKLFGSSDPIGKAITMENAYEEKIVFTVTGVVDDAAGRSHLHPNIFVSLNSSGTGGFMMRTETWTSNTYVSSYVRLRHDADPGKIARQLPALVEKYGGEQLGRANLKLQLLLQPVTKVHTTPGLMGIQPDKAVEPKFLNTLLLVAMLIQLIACINFMNLSTARASRRAREVGVRKVIGAGRMDLVRQFLMESFLITMLSVMLAAGILQLLMPLFNEMTQVQVPLHLLNARALFTLAGFIVLTGLLAGSYPAFYLSAFRAIRVIKGNFTSHISASGIRRGLVVFQFALSTVLLSGIIVIYSQLNYIKEKDLGFDKDQKLVFSFHSQDAMGHVPQLMNDLEALAEVKGVSNSSQHLAGASFYRNSFFLEGQGEADSKGVDYLIADRNFMRVNGIHLVSGRDFLPTDSGKILINESYARGMGLDPMRAPGTVLYDVQHRSAEIVGVMKDFNYVSLHRQIDGFAVWKRGIHDAPWPILTVSASTSSYAVLLAKIQQIWSRDMPGTPFSYSFLDQQVQRQYETEITMSRIIDSFTVMALIISTMGLFGVAAFSAEQRSKEIGIRKVLGADVVDITGWLSVGYVKLVLVASGIAIPFSWWLMHQWLSGFAFRVSLSWWMFAVAGLLSAGIALATVGYQAIRAALTSPLRSLRSE